MVRQPSEGGGVDPKRELDSAGVSGPGVELLESLRRADWADAVVLLSADVEAAVPQLGTVARGPEECGALLERARSLFPDLRYLPHTRSVGAGVVIDEGFVTGSQTGGTDPTGRAMTATMRLTVTHDDVHVRKVSLHLDRSALDRALGRPVDPMLAMYGEFQALRADMHSDMTVHHLTPIHAVGDEVAATTSQGSASPRRRRRGLVAVAALASLAALAGVGIATLHRSSSTGSLHAAAQKSPHSVAATVPTGAIAAGSTTQVPTAPPSPSIVLSADLAFASNSAAVSPRARASIIRLAGQAHGLRGEIHVDGFTDNVGSVASGRVLSQARADAVASILGAAIGPDPALLIVARGHGEADPVAPNSDAAGRARNRRVTITLPPRP